MSKKHISRTQDHIDFAEIRNGIVILRDGGLRLILLTTSINFALKSDQEQNALIGEYQAFLNSLNFPIQILMQSRKLDLTAYLQSLEQKLQTEKNELIKIQIIDYVSFVRRLLAVTNIMHKQFYIVVPFDPINIKKRSLFDKVFAANSKLEVSISPTEFESYKQELMERAGVVASGLSGMGIRAIPLNTQEAIELFYDIYNPDESNKERLIEVDKLEAPMIEREGE